jgi:hypothetical protein
MKGYRAGDNGHCDRRERCSFVDAETVAREIRFQYYQL